MSNCLHCGTYTIGVDVCGSCREFNQRINNLTAEVERWEEVERWKEVASDPLIPEIDANTTIARLTAEVAQWEKTARYVVGVIGPAAAKCCQGGAVEISEAIRALNDRLKGGVRWGLLGDRRK